MLQRSLLNNFEQYVQLSKNTQRGFIHAFQYRRRLAVGRYHCSAFVFKIDAKQQVLEKSDVVDRIEHLLGVMERKLIFSKLINAFVVA